VLRHGDQDIEVLIKRSRRKTIAIHVYSDQSAELRAPLKCPWREIDDYLAKKLSWIVRAREHFDRQPPARTLQYVDGESHPFLGQSYRLVTVRGRPRTVELLNDAIVVRCASPCDRDVVRRAVENWYRGRAGLILPERLEICLRLFIERAPALEAFMPELTIRKMRARWGSCSTRGEICLNSLLVQKPVATIDYVIMHELCHLRHFNHDKGFYRLLGKIMPDWRERAGEL